MEGPERLLRLMALSDDRLIREVLDPSSNVEVSQLDRKTRALARVAALLALNASPASYQGGVEAAFAAGATEEEVVGTLVAVTPEIGLAHAVALAPALAAAMGYDVESAFQAREGAGG
ncbi:MAG TPA: carboxymuconolactone decarboxylase family protein [Actinomycetota bacterium]|nr:carboxymuconolactone decarboxylase family protein [Actinomycetota bacterium]